MKSNLDRLGGVYQACSDLLPELRQELKNNGAKILGETGDLLLTDRIVENILWAQNIWLQPKLIEFESVSQAAKALKEMGRNWVFHPLKEFRRAKLIAE